MVDGLPTIFVLVVFQQREVDHPAEGEHVFVDQIGAAADLQAQVAQALGDHTGLVGDDQNQIARLGARRLDDLAHFFGAEEFGNLAAQRIRAIDCPSASGSPVTPIQASPLAP